MIIGGVLGDDTKQQRYEPSVTHEETYVGGQKERNYNNDVQYHKIIDKDGRGMRGERRTEMVNVT